jgi:peptidoglycan/xylan/chitin deacetylase (PgdA/CDA1 family)
MKLTFGHKIKRSIAAIAATVLLSTILLPVAASAAVVNPTATAKVSFTFDDGLASNRTLAAPTLAKYGMTGTAYVTTKCIGMTAIPNTCHADTGTPYMTWAQVGQLKTQYGWEIGSHTATHPYLASSDASDGQPNVLTPAQVTQELVQSKADLKAQGIDATAFASPYGDYNPSVLSEVAKYYSSHRGFADTGYNSWPNSDYLVRVQQVQTGVTVAQVKAYVDAAILNKQWLVLVFHDIKTLPGTNPADYQYSNANLDQIAAYVKSKSVPVVNASNGLVTSDVNLLANGSFNSGIAGGWTTSHPANVVADSGTNGSYPDPAKSVKITAAASGNVHLFSAKVPVDPNTTYMLKNYINVKQLTSGEFGFYIDEYDASGNWISGQWKGAERTVFAENFNFNYKPTSPAVAQSSLQIYATGASGITAYVDNAQWFPLSAVTTPPTQTNLVTNSAFDNGIADGWTTDTAANVSKDAASNGSPANVVNSIKFASTTKNIHLFSPQVPVVSTKTYSLTSYVNIKQITSGEVGFYIDEYDASGNWISGQWKGARTTVAASDLAVTYKPSSANVAKASLQIYATGNTGILAYADNVRWYAL